MNALGIVLICVAVALVMWVLIPKDMANWYDDDPHDFDAYR